ncbi:MAG: DMT family transporter [Paramuribaculum sp.]|nr:DMT family transporter [Paramuribaculum sp.]
MTLNNLKGYALAALAAAAYGTNPVFAIPLYQHGMNPNSVLLFRYLIGLPLLACIMKMRGISFALRRGEILRVVILGFLMAVSSLTLFESYRFMNSGIASTLLFVYPIMVAVGMIFLFNEKFKASTALCLATMCAGLCLLMKPQADETLSLMGVLLVMVSAGTYAIYIIFVNASKTIRAIPTTRLLFYVLMAGTFFYICIIPAGFDLTIPERSADWWSLTALAIIPTVVSLACTTRAIQLIGSTPTAIFGALEPVSAVALSVTILGQTITGREIFGGILIIAATTIVVADNSVDKLLLHVRKMFPRRKKTS